MQLHGYSLYYNCPPFSSAAPLSYGQDPPCREGSRVQLHGREYVTKPVSQHSHITLCDKYRHQATMPKTVGMILFSQVSCDLSHSKAEIKYRVGLRTVSHVPAEKKTGRGEVISSMCWPMRKYNQEFEGWQPCQRKWSGSGWERHFSSCSLLVMPLFSH